MNLLQNLKTKLEGIDTEQAKKVKDKIDKCITQLNNRNSLKESDIATISKEITIAAQTNLLRNLKAKLGGKHRFLHNVKNICLYSFQALHRLDYKTGIYIDYKINKYIKQLQSGKSLNEKELSSIEKYVDKYRPDQIAKKSNQS